MKKLSKVLALMLAIAFFALTIACGGGNGGPKKTTDNPPSVSVVKITGQIVVEGGIPFTVVSETANGNTDVFLKKLGELGENGWEEPALATPGNDKCVSVKSRNGHIYMFCVDSENIGAIFVEKLDSATGKSRAEVKISDKAIPKGMIINPQTGDLYLSYNEGGTDRIARIDENLNMLGYVSAPTGVEFTGIMDTDADSELLVVAKIGSPTRIGLLKYKEDLSSLIGKNQLHNAGYSPNGDDPTGGVDDGDEFLVSGSVHMSPLTANGTIIEFSTSTMLVAGATEISEDATGLEEMEVNPDDGSIWGILKGSVTKIEKTQGGMTITDLKIKATHWAPDFANKKFYVSDSSKVTAYDLGGNQI